MDWRIKLALYLGGVFGIWYFIRMEDIKNLAKTIWGEARGESPEGQEAVANVVMNRVGAGKWFSGTVTTVVTRPYQFSAWNPDDPNSAKMDAEGEKMTPSPSFARAVAIAARAMSGQLPDRTGGATHYHSRYMTTFPKWAKTPEAIQTAVIGTHIFYKGVL